MTDRELRLWTHHDSRPRKVVIAGGGVAALESAIMLRTLAPEAVAVTLACPETTFRWRAERIAESYGADPASSHSLPGICAGLGAEFVHDSLSAVRRETREVVMRSGAELEYDELLLAVGAHPYPAFESGVTYHRPADAGGFDEVLDDLDDGFIESMAFVVPPGVSWPLPAYELALAAAARRPELSVTLVTPEPGPLAMFGARASETVGQVLATGRVAFVSEPAPQVESGVALRAGGKWLTADRVVSLPLLAGPRIPGVPCDENGYTLIGEHHAVPGCDDRIFAVGDGCATPIAQGGIAAQQATVACTRILEHAGVQSPATPTLEPVLRAVLTTPDGPLYLRSDPESPELTSEATTSPLWAAPGKVASPWLGRYLAGTGRAEILQPT
jgi:sulfide:quinone oxidoreductase